MPNSALKLHEEMVEQVEPILRVVDLHTWFEIRRLGFFKAGCAGFRWREFELYRGETVSIVGERLRKKHFSENDSRIAPSNKGELLFPEQQPQRAFKVS